MLTRIRFSKRTMHDLCMCSLGALHRHSQKTGFWPPTIKTCIRFQHTLHELPVCCHHVVIYFKMQIVAAKTTLAETRQCPRWCGVGSDYWLLYALLWTCCIRSCWAGSPTHVLIFNLGLLRCLLFFVANLNFQLQG